LKAEGRKSVDNDAGSQTLLAGRVDNDANNQSNGNYDTCNSRTGSNIYGHDDPQSQSPWKLTKGLYIGFALS
jgi:hypothetical protein